VAHSVAREKNNKNAEVLDAGKAATPCQHDHVACVGLQGGPKKRGHRVMTIVLSNLNRLKKLTHTLANKRFLVWLLTTPLPVIYP